MIAFTHPCGGVNTYWLSSCANLEDRDKQAEGGEERKEGGWVGGTRGTFHPPAIPQAQPLSFRRVPPLAVHVMSLASCCFPRQNLVEPILGDEEW